jgi:hypothetical protein
MKARKSQARGMAKVSHLFLSGSEPRKEKVTIQMAAKALKVSRGTIVSYLNKGLLTRIKEGGGIYIALDEVRALSETNKELHAKSSVSTSSESTSRASVTKKRDGLKRPLASFGLLESERQYLLRCKAALEAKDKELETLKFQVDNLKRNLETQARELAGTKTKVRGLEKDKRQRLADFKSTGNADDQDLLEKTQARLFVVEEELKRLRHPSWWKELFGRLQLRPEHSMKKEVVLFGTLTLLAVLIFSVWWFNRSPQQPPFSMTEGKASRSGTTRAIPRAVLDLELQQEQSARADQQPSEPTPTAVKMEPAALKVQTPQPYSSSVVGSPSSEQMVSPLPSAGQQLVGLTSTAPPYVLRAETLATTWLHLVIDERQKLEYLLQPNEKHTWRASSGFRLHIGNAAGLQLHLNGQPLKPLGKSDQVVHLQLPDPSLFVTSTPNTPN